MAYYSPRAYGPRWIIGQGWISPWEHNFPPFPWAVNIWILFAIWRAVHSSHQFRWWSHQPNHQFDFFFLKQKIGDFKLVILLVTSPKKWWLDLSKWILLFVFILIVHTQFQNFVGWMIYLEGTFHVKSVIISGSKRKYRYDT